MRDVAEMFDEWRAVPAFRRDIVLTVLARAASALKNGASYRRMCAMEIRKLPTEKREVRARREELAADNEDAHADAIRLAGTILRDIS